MNPVPRPALLAAFLRSFLIQGSWNYRTMIGGGFAFAILPALRWVYRGRPGPLARAVNRHTEHFNAHPYMAGLAVGAAVRLEEAGADEEAVRRFKSAVRGPLGGLGDRLIWAGWLPVSLLVGLVLTGLGASAPVVVIGFLLVYNVGHLALRVWAFRAGLEAGPAVARRLQAAELGQKTERVQLLGALLLGVLVGVLLFRSAQAGSGGWLTAGAGLALFTVGARLGARIWRFAALGLGLLILLLMIVGMAT